MPNILLIEDDENLAMGIEYALKKEGFDIISARSVNEGFNHFKNNDINLVLLDVMLPDGSGFDLCKKIREKSDVPIIFLTACDEEVNVVMGLDMGGDDYIVKPFRVRELISRIKAALRRTSYKSRSDIISSGDVALYPLEAKATYKNKELYLTPVEYKLLSLFLKSAGKVVTRESILSDLWDINGEFVDDNTLSVYIRRLREKLEDDPSKPNYILTVRGIGYKWNKTN